MTSPEIFERGFFCGTKTPLNGALEAGDGLAPNQQDFAEGGELEPKVKTFSKK